MTTAVADPHGRVVGSDLKVQGLGDRARAHQRLEPGTHVGQPLAPLFFDPGPDAHFGFGVVEQAGDGLDQRLS
jgi:hypothetical protein